MANVHTIPEAYLVCLPNPSVERLNIFPHNIELQNPHKVRRSNEISPPKVNDRASKIIADEAQKAVAVLALILCKINAPNKRPTISPPPIY